jgi:2-phosphoglycolate phosphatase
VDEGDFSALRVREIGIPEKRRMYVDAVVFDLDGTLIDTLDIYCRVLNVALERLGLEAVAKETVVDAAREGAFEWGRVLPGIPESSVEDIVGRLREIIEDLYKKALDEDAEMIPGASEILIKINNMGLKMALVTSTPWRYLQIKLNPLRNAGVADLFDVVITSDDVLQKKPAPDPLITCGQRLGVPTERAVYVGDSRVDIRAGRAAGMRTAGVLTGMEDRESLARERPDAILDSVAGLVSLLDRDG